ncbi:MAG TPA: arginine--tRNA ligase [Terracidiphilus sp.]|nr:arginine--tRNA ligase [Terracidiphilus sp.]
MYLELQQRLGAAIRTLLKEKYSLEIENIPLETPPDLRLGEIATPIALQLARTLRKAPRIIAQEIVAALGSVEGFAGFEVAGAGYINARLDRGAAVRLVVCAEGSSPSAKEHVLVEHTSINPNKAAHIGHLRNAILGDTFVRLLRAAGNKVDVQNYIDNTGVQVADVVVGFLHLEDRSVDEVRALIVSCEKRVEDSKSESVLYQGTTSVEPNEQLNQKGALAPVEKLHPFDYYCWDLYARTSAWYGEGAAEEQAARKLLRYATLHEIEAGGNETAQIAELISTAVLRRHLETMQRLDIEYDFLPRESEILRLKFWDAAFEQLKATGVLYFESEGKNKGCWVMSRPGYLDREIKISPQARKKNPYDYKNPEDRFEYEDSIVRDSEGVNESAEGPDEDAKVIVRSNGTVTYVGKDIAYHLWKFGLLGKDFGYKTFFSYPSHECWISTTHGDENHPHFGGATAIYNVIDSRQADPQANVIQALRGMGFVKEADHYTHFGYEMVALTPRCAAELGYEVAEEDLGRPYIEVSGRKGFGVKADDLIDKLIAAVQPLVDEKQAASPEPVRRKIALQIAIGALRYFMLKYTRNSVIAFDFKDALSFEGETGPYIQYAVVRIRNIFRKGETTPEAVLADFSQQLGVLKGHDFSRAESPSRNDGALAPEESVLATYLRGEDNEDIWALWLRAGRFSLVLDQCIAASEPAYLAKHAFQLAQEFANFYHKHHILTEENSARKTFLLATAAVTLRELVRSLALLGIESPEAM